MAKKKKRHGTIKIDITRIDIENPNTTAKSWKLILIYKIDICLYNIEIFNIAIDTSFAISKFGYCSLIEM